MGHLSFGASGKVRKGTPDAWLPVAAQIAQYARKFAGRGDIVANVGPGVGGPYATACWSHYLADLDVNTETCLPGYAPDKVDFSDEIFQLGALPFVGAVTHEAAHARWTAWTPYDLIQRRKADAEPWNQATIEVVVALEESRIERLAVSKDPTKRDALAQCALSIVLRDFKVNNTLFGASLSLALTVGRYSILSVEEISNFRAMIEPHLPFGLMAELESLIREYHALPALLAKPGIRDTVGGVDDRFYRSMYDIADRWLIAIRKTAAKVEEEQKRAAEKAERARAERAEREEREAAERQDSDADDANDADKPAEPSEDDEPAAPGDESDEDAPSAPSEDAEDGEDGDEPGDEGAGEGAPQESGARGEDADAAADAEGAAADPEGAPSGEAVAAERESEGTDVESFDFDGEPEGEADGEYDDEPGEHDAEDGVDDEGGADADDYADRDDYDEDAHTGVGRGDASDVEYRYDEDGEGEPVEGMPERDAREPQPDLRSGIPGEDEHGEAVVIIITIDEDGEPVEEPEDGAESDGEPEDSPLGEDIRKAAGAAAMDREADALDARAEKVTERAIADRREDAGRRSEAAAIRDERHGEKRGASGFSLFCDSHRRKGRAPIPGERVAANRLAAVLERITFHDRAVRKVDRVTPGGKLRPRAAVAKAADRARGGRAEIPEWRAKERRHTAETPVTVGIMTDVSGSMGSNEEPSAVLTYVLSNAVSRIDGKVATAVFGARGYLVNRAYERATEVQQWAAKDGTEAFREGALLLDAELNLLDGDGARILVIFTDSQLVDDDDEAYARTFMRLCKRKNVAVVWCSYHQMPVSNFGHGAVLSLDGSAADIANTLGETILTEVKKIEASRSAG